MKFGKVLQPSGGKLNFASLHPRRGLKSGISYGTSKGVVEQMTHAMAETWSRYGITANAIAPRFFQTELTTAVFSDLELTEKNANQTCIGSNGEISDMDGLMIFLCAPASIYVMGQILFVDGGYTAK